jgi:hypothetical protein
LCYGGGEGETSLFGVLGYGIADGRVESSRAGGVLGVGVAAIAIVVAWVDSCFPRGHHSEVRGGRFHALLLLLWERLLWKLLLRLWTRSRVDSNSVGDWLVWRIHHEQTRFELSQRLNATCTTRGQRLITLEPGAGS